MRLRSPVASGAPVPLEESDPATPNAFGCSILELGTTSRAQDSGVGRRSVVRDARRLHLGRAPGSVVRQAFGARSTLRVRARDLDRRLRAAQAGHLARVSVLTENLQVR